MDAWAPHAHYIQINHMKMLFMIIFCGSKQKEPSPGGLEPPTFRLTAERANRLRHGDFHEVPFLSNLIVWIKIFTYVRFPLQILSSSQELTCKRPEGLDTNCLAQ